MILTLDYLRGFYDGVMHKDTPAADACRQVEKTFYTAKDSAIEAGKMRIRPPVVRCKDCIYWQDNNGGYPVDGCKWRKDETPDPDDYCSWGDRQQDEEGE